MLSRTVSGGTLTRVLGTGVRASLETHPVSLLALSTVREVHHQQMGKRQGAVNSEQEEAREKMKFFILCFPSKRTCKQDHQHDISGKPGGYSSPNQFSVLSCSSSMN